MRYACKSTSRGPRCCRGVLCCAMHCVATHARRPAHPGSPRPHTSTEECGDRRAPAAGARPSATSLSLSLNIYMCAFDHGR
eukprot:365847-Chlamydomonas_euryale.AAC.37